MGRTRQTLVRKGAAELLKALRLYDIVIADRTARRFLEGTTPGPTALPRVLDRVIERVVAEPDDPAVRRVVDVVLLVFRELDAGETQARNSDLNLLILSWVLDFAIILGVSRAGRQQSGAKGYPPIGGTPFFTSDSKTGLFAPVLARYMRRSGLSSGAFGNTNRATVRRWLKGERCPNDQHLRDVAVDITEALRKLGRVDEFARAQGLGILELSLPVEVELRAAVAFTVIWRRLEARMSVGPIPLAAITYEAGMTAYHLSRCALLADEKELGDSALAAGAMILALRGHLRLLPYSPEALMEHLVTRTRVAVRTHPRLCRGRSDRIAFAARPASPRAADVRSMGSGEGAARRSAASGRRPRGSPTRRHGTN